MQQPILIGWCEGCEVAQEPYIKGMECPGSDGFWADRHGMHKRRAFRCDCGHHEYEGPWYFLTKHDFDEHQKELQNS